MAQQQVRVAKTAYQRTRDAVEVVAANIAEMLRPLSDASTPIPRSEWSVGEAAAHLAITQALFIEGLKGMSSPYGDGHSATFAQVNTQMLSEFGERDGAKLAELLVARTRAFLEESAGYHVQHRIHYHFGTMDLPTWTSYMLVHLLMHGCPIATALGQPLPLERAHTELAIPFFKATMPRIVDKEAARKHQGSIDVRIRGGGRLVVTIHNGSVTVSDLPTGPVDCFLSADPVAFLLVALGLASQWGLIARGKLLAWGRRPWLALRFKMLFPNP
jgi:uncharacterized protein (TIGR03083 family)